jgi:hypothetical protein
MAGPRTCKWKSLQSHESVVMFTPAASQRFLLGEMIKASSVDVSLLAEFIKAHNIEQNWMNMQLPIGMYSGDSGDIPRT